MKLKSSGVPYNDATIRGMCGCGGGDTKHNMADLTVQKLCGCGGHSVDGDHRPTLPKRGGK